MEGDSEPRRDIHQLRPRSIIYRNAALQAYGAAALLGLAGQEHPVHARRWQSKPHRIEEVVDRSHIFLPWPEESGIDRQQKHPIMHVVVIREDGGSGAAQNAPD